MNNQQPSILNIYLASLEQVNATFAENSRRMKPVIVALPKAVMIERLNRVLTFLKDFPQEKLVTNVPYGHLEYEKYITKEIKKTDLIGILPLCLPEIGIGYYDYLINDTAKVQRVGVVTNGNYHIELDDYLRQYFGLSKEWYFYLFVHNDCENVPAHEVHSSLVQLWEIFILGITEDEVPFPHVDFKDEDLDKFNEIIERIHENLRQSIHLN